MTPVNAMVNNRRGVQAECSNAQKAREVLAQRRAVEAETEAEAARLHGCMAGPHVRCQFKKLDLVAG
ncbi:hypothetical protein HaLaN_06563 [Haematococcus lacustris]|uniref:Uncharacterized protein n=1 Tax=Haematococcus lacustris TaxID=44745 RepID=A0A699YM72_HAELA|nr:hypothetical protein HaLaN_06563 [Haematococcus lacustris]